MSDLIDMEYLEAKAGPAPVLHATAYAPGIYFGLPEDEYHAAPALSASGMKHLLVSPMDFWARCKWLNPDAEAETSDAMELGKAYDLRIVEGRERFYQKYAAALDVSKHPAALRTADEIKERLKALGLPVSGKKADLTARLLVADSSAEILDTLLADHAANHEGKELLPVDLLHRIEIAAAMIERHPELSKAFSGGHPQVSIFWIDAETGVPMKARLDYLKASAIVDLKTFSNPLGKPLDKAIAYSMASRKYHVQASLYHEAVDAAKALIREHGGEAIHGDVHDAWIKAFLAGDHRFLFVFQQTGVAPVARGFVFPKYSTYDLGKIAIREAKDRYAFNWRTFGTDPWVDQSSVGTFEDSDFPAFIGD